MLGGDCTVGVGTVAGAVAAGADPRLVYLDLHPDLNTPGSVPDGALDWMGVAHMLDVEGADERLAAAGPRGRCCADDDLVLLGAGPEQSTAAERAAIAARDLRPIGVDGAARRSRAAAARARSSGPPPAAGASSCTSTSTSSTSPTCRCRRTPAAASACRSRRRCRARASCSPTTRCSALTVTELNPHHGAQDGADVARLARALAGALRAV